MLRFLARFIAVVCAILFVCITVPTVFFHAAGTRVARSPIYKDALTGEGIYARLPALTEDLVSHSTTVANRGEKEAGGEVLRQLTPEDWTILFGAILPPDYLQAQTEGALDQFFGWVHSDAPTPVVKLSFADLKRRLTSGEAETAYQKILESKPPCTEEQVRAAAGGLSLACRPPPELMPQVLDGFRKAMQSAAEGIPDAVDVFEKITAGGGSTPAIQTVAQARSQLVRMELYATWSPAVPAALLLLIVLFGVRSFRGLLLWWGIPCLIAGAAAAVFALPAAPLANWVFTEFIVPQLPKEVPAATLSAVVGLVLALVQQVLRAALKTAAILAVGGLVAVILSAFFKSRPKPAVAA